MSRLNDAGATVYRTDAQGTVVAQSDGQEITFTTQKMSRRRIRRGSLAIWRRSTLGMPIPKVPYAGLPVAASRGKPGLLP